MTLVRYLFRRFIPVFIGAVLLSALVLNLVDLLMNLWRYIQNQSPPLEVLRVMLLYTPKTFWYAIPLGILFATSYTLSALYVSNELSAVFMSGVSLFKFTAPLLLFALAMSFALFFLDDRIAVDAYAKKQELQNALLNQQTSLDNESLVIIADGGEIVYKADLYDDAQRRLYNLYVVFRNGAKFRALVHADQASWSGEENRWRLQNAVQYLNDGGEVFSSALSDELALRLTEPAETFRSNVVDVEEVPAREAKEYIERLQRTGLPYAESLSLYYKKFAFPFIVFIVVFLSIGLSGRARKNAMLASLSLSLAAAVAFYVTQMVTMLLAKFGYISAFSGAWFPVFLFIAISAALLRFTRT